MTDKSKANGLSEALADRLSQRNVPDYEIDSIVATARGMAGLSPEQLAKIEAMASAKKGNKIIEYHDEELSSPTSISEKLEEVRMKVKCRKSLLNPSMDFDKLSDYIIYDENKPYMEADHFNDVEIASEKRPQKESAKRAYLASKFVTKAVEKGKVDSDILTAVDTIVDAQPKLAAWGAAIIKKAAISENLTFPISNPHIVKFLGDKLPEFKLSLGYDMIDRTTAAGVPMKNSEIEYILTETNMPPADKLGVIRSHLNDEKGDIAGGVYAAMESIARQNPQHIPEIMDLLSHRKMEQAHSGKGRHNFSHDWVIRACIEKDPSLMTQKLYNDLRNKIELSGAWRENPTSGKVTIITQNTVGGYSEDRDAVSYMDSVNPNFKKQWRESRDLNNARTNSNSRGERVN